MPQHAVYCFGPYEVRTRSREVYKNGIKLKLRSQPFEVLLTLVEHSRDVVTREELRGRLWPSDTFVDFEHGLNTAITELRGLLNDSASEPRYIETLPKLGYRIVVPVEVVEPAVPSGPLQKGVTQQEAMVAESLPTPAGPAPVDESSGSVRNALTQKRWTIPAVIVVILILGLAAYVEWSHLRARAQASNGRAMLAVLPFENLTGDASQDYFSDGLTEEMITQLGQLDPQHLGVIARTSVMHYKHSQQPLQQIGRELGVQYVLEGGVRRDSNNVRISAQLIQMKDQTRLWSRQYDRELSSLLILQGEIARGIADEIQLTLEDSKTVAPISPLNIDAYDDYLKGRNYVWRQAKDDVVRGMEFLERSIQRDPNYAPAYAELSLAYQLLALFNHFPPREVLPKAKAAAMKALALDENLAEAHVVLGSIYGWYEWDWATQERELRRAVQLDPNSSFARQSYAAHLVVMRRKTEAMQELNTTLELDPFSPQAHSGASLLFVWIREYDAAIREARRALEIDPGYPIAHGALAAALGAKGAFDESFTEWLRFLRLDGDGELAHELESAAKKISAPGDPGQKLAHITLSYYRKKSKTQYVAALTIAEAYIDLGDKEKALEWLNKAYEERSPDLYTIAVAPNCDPLRDDPRFQDLLRRVGLAHSDPDRTARKQS
jgi:FimV-like protein